MESVRKLQRRSFLRLVTAGAFAGGAMLLPLGEEAEASRRQDHDRGPHADRIRHARTGITDTDQGPNADPAGGGRGGRGRCSGVTDRDRGRLADVARCGRGGRPEGSR